VFGDVGGVVEEGLEEALRFGAAWDGDGFQHADAGVEGGDIRSLNYGVWDF
jgi:hypothetical protein